MKLTVLSCLLILSLSLTSCSSRDDYSKYNNLQPVRFSPDTKAWLLSHQPWPEFVIKDFAELAKLNDKLKLLANQTE